MAGRASLRLYRIRVTHCVTSADCNLHRVRGSFQESQKTSDTSESFWFALLFVLCRSFNFPALSALDYFVHVNIIGLDINTKVFSDGL